MVPSEGRVDVHVPPRLCRCPFKHLIFIFRAARSERRSPGNQEAGFEIVLDNSEAAARFGPFDSSKLRPGPVSRNLKTP